MKSPDMDTDITVWCSAGKPSSVEGVVCKWDGHGGKGQVHSLLDYAEENGERLRRKYLAWIHEIGESRIDGKRLIDRLVLKNGMSYWWMTPLVEKCPDISPITDAIRLLALEEIIMQHHPVRIRLVDGERWLNRVIGGLSERMGIPYEWERLTKKRHLPAVTRRFYRRLFRATPQPLQAMVSLTRYIWRRWPLRKTDNTGWLNGDRSLFICSYFFNVAPEMAREGLFYSRYWEGLDRLLEDLDLHGNWLQLYYRHDAVPDTGVAMEWVQGFNRTSGKEGFHTFLDSYLGLRIIYRVIRNWLKLALISVRIRKGAREAFRPEGSNLSLWPLMRGEWLKTMRGPIAIRNLLWIELFQEALSNIPHQGRGLYLFEGYAWERALIHNWRRQGHGELIGVAHATIRFWDLRNFNDTRTIRSAGPHPMPQPDYLALNGRVAVDAYLDMGYPREAIVECEALRYHSLNDYIGRSRSHECKGEKLKVLILGDYNKSATIKMIHLLEAAASQVQIPVTYTVKPHPNYPVNPELFPSLDLDVVTEPLGEILNDYDIAYASNTTSAALDAYVAGLPVVVMLDDTTLNFSPLRGCQGVSFAGKAEDLARSLSTASRGTEGGSDEKEYFFLEPALPRWRRLLENEKFRVSKK